MRQSHPFFDCLASLATAVRRPDDEEIRRRLADVYARPEFQSGGRDASWLWQRFLRFADWLSHLQGTNPVLYWTLLTVCILLLLALVGHIAWTVRRVLTAGGEGTGAAEAARARQRLSQGFREDAGRCADRGDFTEAIRYLFLSLVYCFDESGRVSFRGAYTNREYLGLFDDRPREHTALAVFVDTLDEHWYGQHPTDRTRYADCLALYEGLT